MAGQLPWPCTRRVRRLSVTDDIVSESAGLLRRPVECDFDPTRDIRSSPSGRVNLGDGHRAQAAENDLTCESPSLWRLRHGFHHEGSTPLSEVSYCEPGV